MEAAATAVLDAMDVAAAEGTEEGAADSTTARTTSRAGSRDNRDCELQDEYICTRNMSYMGHRGFSTRHVPYISAIFY